RAPRGASVSPRRALILLQPAGKRSCPSKYAYATGERDACGEATASRRSPGGNFAGPPRENEQSGFSGISVRKTGKSNGAAHVERARQVPSARRWTLIEAAFSD